MLKAGRQENNFSEFYSKLLIANQLVLMAQSVNEEGLANPSFNSLMSDTGGGNRDVHCLYFQSPSQKDICLLAQLTFTEDGAAPLFFDISSLEFKENGAEVANSLFDALSKVGLMPTSKRGEYDFCFTTESADEFYRYARLALTCLDVTGSKVMIDEAKMKETLKAFTQNPPSLPVATTQLPEGLEIPARRSTLNL